MIKTTTITIKVVCVVSGRDGHITLLTSFLDSFSKDQKTIPCGVVKAIKAARIETGTTKRALKTGEKSAE